MQDRILWLCVPMLLNACVSAGAHEDLKKKYDEVQADLADGHIKIQGLEQQVAVLAQQHRQDAALISAQADESQRLAGELAEVAKDRSRLTESADQLKQALAELSARRAEVEKRAAEFRAMLVRFKNLIDAGTLRVRIVDGRMVLALPTDVLFDSGSAKLSQLGKAAVRQVGTVLAGMTDRRFQIEGHTDNVPINTDKFPSNWELAAERALGVVRELMSSGVQSETLSSASYGEYHPVAPNETDLGRAENRRIEIVLVPNLSALPEFNELERAVSLQ